MMCQHPLAVQKQTPYSGVLLELGRVPLDIFAIKLAIKNWEHLKNKKGNVIILASLDDAILENLNLIKGVKKLHREERSTQPLYQPSRKFSDS